MLILGLNDIVIVVRPCVCDFSGLCTKATS
jgi:hypothetical protein